MSRNGVGYLQFRSAPERVILNKFVEIHGGRDKSEILEGVEGALNVLRIRNMDETNPYLILTCSDGTSTNSLTMTKGQVVVSTKLGCTWYDSSGDNDVSFRRNGVEYFTLDDANSVVNVVNSIGVSTSNVYTNRQYLEQVIGYRYNLLWCS